MEEIDYRIEAKPMDGVDECSDCKRKILDGADRYFIHWAEAGRKTVCRRCALDYRPRSAETSKGFLRLSGKITRETEKAVLFSQGGNANDLEWVGKAWFPKSKIAVFERALGDLDQIEVPEWLVRAKQEAAQ